MKSKFKFSIESLLHGLEYPKGKIEHITYAQKVAAHVGMDRFNCLAQIKFEDPQINKAFPGGIHLDETLVVGLDNYSSVKLHICIRSKQSTCKIASGNSSSREIKIHNAYRDVVLLKKLSDKQIAEIFNFVWDNLELIQPNPKRIEEDF
ncbi:hypothetical protein [Sphingobacterium detergens]|uniref:Uncharacterized protein n=1 Tax=Sphingobacterium detergens TaxID=1145106 RepID=A0A420ARQ0_SPHD1|nr:hypothetical protein [Sphingobacterium detergens]RKE47142.1 hypothetical protein DFQ12_4303 [Sphingobacterium detergens]